MLNYDKGICMINDDISVAEIVDRIDKIEPNNSVQEEGLNINIDWNKALDHKVNNGSVNNGSVDYNNSANKHYISCVRDMFREMLIANILLSNDVDEGIKEKLAESIS